MTFSLLLSPGFWIFAIVIMFDIAIHVALLMSFLSAWTDDREWKISGLLAWAYKRVPPLGNDVIEELNQREFGLAFFGIIVNITLTVVIGIVAGFIVYFLWPLAVLIAGAYIPLRLVRFARRTKKVVGKVVEVAHGHGKGGKVKKIKKIDYPEF